MKLRFLIEDGRAYGGPESGIAIDCIGEVASCHYLWDQKYKAYGTQEEIVQTREYKSDFRHVAVSSLEELTALHIKVMAWAKKQKLDCPNMIMIGANCRAPSREHLIEGVHMPSQTLRFWEICD